MANGRPWYVRYANSATGVAGLHAGEIGPFDTPFQPSNEAEQLVMDADPLMYKSFSTEAAANAWIASSAGKSEAKIGSGPAGAAQDVFHGLNLATWFQRIGEVLLGIVLIGVGIAKLTGTDNAVSGVVKKAGKAAIFA